MLLNYLLIVSLFGNGVRCFLVLPFQLPDVSQYVQPEILPKSDNVGEPLILTPYLKANQTTKARELSNVKPFFKDVVSNSGFFTVNETYNSNLFFWFFRKTGADWEKAPLLLYLEGGPGASSMYGLFEENGPFRITTKNKLERRKFSWTNDYNVIYIDQPIGTGFSFTNDSAGRIRSQEQVADHLYEALTQFFLLYPELNSNAFYITGESYGGRYAPAIAYRIHTLKVAGKCSINLKGLFLLAATTDGIGVTQNMADFCFSIGVIDSQVRDETRKMEEEVKYYVHAGLLGNATLERMKIYKKIMETSHVNLYDYTQPAIPYETRYLVNFLQSTDTRKKIHVGSAKYSLVSLEVLADFSDDILKSVKPWVEVLLEHYPIAFVLGQYDIMVSYYANLFILESLRWGGAVEYSKAIRRTQVDKRKVVGYYYKSAGNLKDILVRRAGHNIFKAQPQVAYDVLSKFINNKF